MVLMEEPLKSEAGEVKQETLESLGRKIDGILDATKELTKVVGDLAKEVEKYRKAGRF